MSTRSDKIAAVANAPVKECGGLMLAVLSGALVFLEKLQVGVVNKAPSALGHQSRRALQSNG